MLGLVSAAIDSAVRAVSPRAAVRREVARMQLRRYEAAAHGRRTAGWRASEGSANAQIARDLPTLRKRSRDLTENNAWASKAVGLWEGQVVERGIVAVPGMRTGQRKRDLRRTIELWMDWAGTAACDFDGRQTIGGLQRLAQREVTEAGEVLIRRRFVRRSLSLPIPMQLQIIEGDYLDTTKDARLRNGGRIIQGIEFNSAGRRVAYHLYKEHPGDPWPMVSGSLESTRVPAEEILHIYRQDRAGQVRGVPWGAPALLTTRDFDDFLDAELLRVKIAASFAGFIKDLDPQAALEQLQQTLPVGGVSDSGSAKSGTRHMEIEPGMLEVLPHGRDVIFNRPPQVENLGDYSNVSLRQVAAGYGVPYEALANDLRGINFSGGRLGRLDYRSSVESWQILGIIPQLCAPAWGWFIDGAMRFGGLEGPISASWTPPPARMIEPGREIGALEKQVQSGLISLSEAIRRQGGNPEETMDELAQDRERAEELGLDLSVFRAPAGSPVASGKDDDDDDDDRKPPVDA